jgi:hypothetical protein
MTQEVRTHDTSGLAQELEGALTALDASLAQAGRAVGTIRSQVSRFAELADLVEQMELAMTRARQSLEVVGAGGAIPPLRAVPPSAPIQDSYGTPSTTETPSYEGSPPSFDAPEPAFGPAAIDEEEPSPDTSATEAKVDTPETADDAGYDFNSERPVSHCLRLGVTSKSGSLDLKAVDGSVNENPAVVDVALLDYDGRQATLKLWINNAADPQGVRDALFASLRRRLGDEKEADVKIDFEEGNAA